MTEFAIHGITRDIEPTPAHHGPYPDEPTALAALTRLRTQGHLHHTHSTIYALPEETPWRSTSGRRSTKAGPLTGGSGTPEPPADATSNETFAGRIWTTPAAPSASSTWRQPHE